MRQLLTFLTVPLLLAVGAPAPAQKPAAPDHKPAVSAVIACPNPLDGRTIVFVANGAGGGETCSESLRQASADMHAGLAVKKASWGRQGTFKGDLYDTPAQLRAAGRLAERFQCLRSECPHSRFVFVGYSAGARVVLAAAEQLPPGSLDRIVLLGATVSSYYNLQRALCASCGGIDNFFSRNDSLLDMAQSMWGTTDGLKGPMAGVAGFRCPPGMIIPEYGNLRQYRWSDKYGGDGTHYYWVSDGFMHRTLVPLLQRPGCPTVAVGPAAPQHPTAPARQPAPTHSEPPLTRSK